MSTILEILLGLAVVLVITVFTGYFVAQEFGYMAVDRARLRTAAASGDVGAKRALDITGRTSFMLSGAQLGITVTGLVVGYVAEPMIGDGVAVLFGLTGLPSGVSTAIGIAIALLVATVVQMVFGELFPKNLAIARPEPVARRLAISTRIYLALFGWLISIFDAASNALLRAVRIEPVHDVEQIATSRDLEAIIDESRDSGDLPPHLSTLLDRVIDFTDRTAREAMIPRTSAATVRGDETLPDLLARMESGHSRYPVVGSTVDDVVGVVYLRDVLALPAADVERLRVSDVQRPPLFVPDTLPLPEVLGQLREAGEEFACVVDEYGGLAGVITVEDVAEELVGEITDEHDPAGAGRVARRSADGWIVTGSMHIDEFERLVDHDVPHGDYNTIGGLVIESLGRLPDVGDTVVVTLPLPPDADVDDPSPQLTLTVRTVERRVPGSLDVRWVSPPATDSHTATDAAAEGPGARPGPGREVVADASATAGRNGGQA